MDDNKRGNVHMHIFLSLKFTKGLNTCDLVGKKKNIKGVFIVFMFIFLL